MKIDDTPIRELEAKLGVPDRFFAGLREETDWSFIIKLAALMEAALSSVIVAALGRPEIADTVVAMSLSDNKPGKLRVAQRLGLLDGEQAAFLKQLQKFRNECAHQIQNVNFDLKQRVNALCDPEVAAFARAAALIPQGKSSIDGETIDFARGRPKELLWLGAMAVLLGLAFRNKDAELANERARLYESFYKAYGVHSFGGLASSPGLTATDAGHGLLGLPLKAEEDSRTAR